MSVGKETDMPIEERDGWIHITPDITPTMRKPTDEDDDFEDIVTLAPERLREPVTEEESS